MASSVEYRDVAGFSGYRVGSDGSFWSCWRYDGKIGQRWRRLKPTLQRLRPSYGVCRVCLVRDRRKFTRSLHRLILEAFVGPCPAGMECCHRNGDPADNRLENLRWDTHSANETERAEHGHVLRGRDCYATKLCEDDVRQMRRLRREGLTFREIAERFGVSTSAAHSAVVGRWWSHVAQEE